MSIKFNSNTVKPNGIAKVYYGSNLVYQSGPSTPDAELKSASNELSDYIVNNGITELHIVDRSAIPTSGITDVTSSLSNCLTNGYAAKGGSEYFPTLYISGLSAGNKVYGGANCQWLFSPYPNATLTTLNLSNFYTNTVTDMYGMFNSNSLLTSLTGLDHFDTSNVTNMSEMFSQCSSLTSVDCSSFNTSNVTNMGSMFASCSALTTADVSNFDTSNVTNVGNMFNMCTSLTTIYVNRSWYPTYLPSVVGGDAMFSGDTHLPNYSSTATDHTMAKLSTEGGYMTFKA